MANNSGRRLTLPRGGFTLAEMLVAIAISSMLFLSLSAAISGTLGATAEVSDQLASWQTLSSALLRMERELSLATQFDAATNTYLEFWVPDITGDASPDCIEYFWNGSPGDPLLRVLNGNWASPQNLLPAAQAVQFSCNYRQKSPVKIAPATRNLAVVPSSFTDYPSNSYTTAYYDVRPTSWRAESFIPITECHRVDSVILRARSTALFGPNSNMDVWLADKSTGRVMATGSLSRFSLAYYSTRTFTVPMTWQDGGGSALATGNEYRWVFKPSGSSYAGDVEAFRITDGGNPDNGCKYEYSTDSGSSYLDLGHQVDVRFITNGTYVINYGTNGTQTETSLRRMDVHLEFGTGKNRAAINSSVRLGNM